MFEIIIIILILINISLNFLVFMIFLHQKFVSGTELYDIVAIAYSCVAIGIFLDSTKILILIFFNYIPYNYILISFIIKSTLLMLATIYAFQIVATSNEQIGLKVKFGEYFKIIYYIFFIFLTIVNISTYVSIDGLEWGNPVILMNSNVYNLMQIIFLPLQIYMLIEFRRLYVKVKGRKLKIQLIFFGLLFIALIYVKNLNNMVFDQGFYNYIYFHLVEQIAILTILVFYVIILFTDSSSLETITNYFSMRAFYIIKDNGQTIFGYKFKNNNNAEDLTQDELMLGGFIYTIASGLSQTLKTSEKVKKIKIRDTTFLLKYGKKIFGLLIVSELSKSIKQKFNRLMIKFEDKYQKELESWTGEISKFDKNLMQQWLEEIFKIC
ncbi:MAG: hypothetical protein EAX96_00240 [Candidatus Lokiarchaeota archaeon]|nr:hypothetical protein [Candidatus Lokiarchaeota archaeon]